MKRRTALAGITALAAPVLPGLAAAQAPSSNWPQAKPITYVVPFTAGGSTDVIGRTLAEKLQAALKQTVVVDNKPGQGGGIGASFTAKALKQPDVVAKLQGQLGMETVGGTPEQLAALMASEIPRWAALVKKSGATAN